MRDRRDSLLCRRHNRTTSRRTKRQTTRFCTDGQADLLRRRAIWTGHDQVVSAPQPDSIQKPDQRHNLPCVARPMRIDAGCCYCVLRVDGTAGGEAAGGRPPDRRGLRTHPPSQLGRLRPNANNQLLARTPTPPLRGSERRQFVLEYLPERSQRHGEEAGGRCHATEAVKKDGSVTRLVTIHISGNLDPDRSYLRATTQTHSSCHSHPHSNGSLAKTSVSTAS